MLGVIYKSNLMIYLIDYTTRGVSSCISGLIAATLRFNHVYLCLIATPIAEVPLGSINSCSDFTIKIKSFVWLISY